VVGWLLGGKIGLGTIIFLVGIGPIVQVALPRLSLTPLAPPVPLGGTLSGNDPAA
jgi:uncharacterized membrane protein YczE